jgi:prepilin-type N-terminal cleavage/methylation domain-containing protein
MKFFSVKEREKGLTLLETLISLVLVGILVAIALIFFTRLLAWIRLNLATAELANQWRYTQLEALGSGRSPFSLCMVEAATEQIRFARIAGDRCEEVTDWKALTRGVKIDKNNSTLRTVAGVAGNGGVIYRVSWADTRGGLGGSWGQLGRLVLLAPGTPAKKCLFLFDVDGSWNIREDRRCDR